MFIVVGLARLITEFGDDGVDGLIFCFLFSLCGDVELQMSEKGIVLIEIIDDLSGLLDGIDDKGYFIFEVDILFDLNVD